MGGSLVHMHLSGSFITIVAVGLLRYTRAFSSATVNVDSRFTAPQLKISQISFSSKLKVVSKHTFEDGCKR